MIRQKYQVDTSGDPTRFGKPSLYEGKVVELEEATVASGAHWCRLLDTEGLIIINDEYLKRIAGTELPKNLLVEKENGQANG